MGGAFLPSLSIKPGDGGRAWGQDLVDKRRAGGETGFTVPWASLQISAPSLMSWAAWRSDLTSLSLSFHTCKVVTTAAYSSLGLLEEYNGTIHSKWHRPRGPGNSSATWSCLVLTGLDTLATFSSQTSGNPNVHQKTPEGLKVSSHPGPSNPLCPMGWACTAAE